MAQLQHGTKSHCVIHSSSRNSTATGAEQQQGQSTPHGASLQQEQSSSSSGQRSSKGKAGRRMGGWVDVARVWGCAGCVGVAGQGLGCGWEYGSRQALVSGWGFGSDDQDGRGCDTIAGAGAHLWPR